MIIEIHAIQNHSPANLNRDDLGAPKTCFFGGVLRSRISSQCIKRSIRLSNEFRLLCGAIRTRRLPRHLATISGVEEVLPLAQKVVEKCGLIREETDSKKSDKKKDVIAFVSKSAARSMADLLCESPQDLSDKHVDSLATKFARIIAEDRFVPDMALSGRMLEPAKPKKPKKGKGDEDSEENEEDAEENKEKGVWKGLDLKIEAALQVAHAISTHEARPEVDYFVAADDVKGDDSGGAHIGEGIFSSSCFYKYFSINWELLVSNLNGNEELAAHTVGAFIQGATLTNPSGKQNSHAAHNLPDGILIEVKKDTPTPTSYANAFVAPVPSIGERDVVSQSIAQLAQYVRDLDVGYELKKERFWFSPNNRHPLAVIEKVKEQESGKERDKEIFLADETFKSVNEIVVRTVKAIGHDWESVKKSVVKEQVES